MVNINTASQAQLETLKGIGPTYAARIIAYRGEHAFVSIEEIQEVKGIGPATFAAIKDSISVDYVPPPPAPKPAPKQTIVPIAEAKEPVESVPEKEAAMPEPVTPRTQPAAVAIPTPAFPLWASVVGLCGLVGLGTASVWYARLQTIKRETSLSADEFEIEE